MLDMQKNEVYGKFLNFKDKILILNENLKFKYLYFHEIFRKMHLKL